MSRIYFTSDLHLGSKSVATSRWSCRQFPSVEEHDEAVIDSISILNKRDKLFILGDVADDIASLYKLAAVGYPNQMTLVRGNHDKFKMEQYLDVFHNVEGFVKFKKMWLSHCPIHPQELWGKINVHGHIHKQLKRDDSLPRDSYYNVNWDFHRGLVSLEQIRDETRV